MPALDGLRAFAVLFVFAHHAFPWWQMAGGIGVDVFFVISGWLITRILLKEYGREGRIKLGQFYAKRFLRLYPALLLMVVTMLALWFLYLRPFWQVAEASVWSLTYLSNLAITLSWGNVDPFGHTWSLAMEEQFYLLWPIVLLVFLRLKLKPWMIVATLLIVSMFSFVYMVQNPVANLSPLARAGAILIGCAAAFIPDIRWMRSNIFGIALALTMVGVLGLQQLRVIHYFTATIAIVFLTAALVMHLVHGNGIVNRILAMKWLVYTGIISYGLYLWHYPILKYLTASLPELSGTGRAVLALALTFGLAALSYHFVERRFNSLKDRIGRSRAVAPAAPQNEAAGAPR